MEATQAWDAELITTKYPLPWQMTPAERLGLIALVSSIRPTRAIEVGSATGGSLQVLSDLCGRVYSLDVDETVPTRLGHFPNVEFLIGDSRQTLPALIRQLSEQRLACEFMLIDGDHSAEGIRADIESLIRLQPVTKTYVVMHDSFNPAVRQGMREADWSSSPHVSSVDLDFIQGWYHSREDGREREMWGGLALAVLSPEPRTTALQIKESQRATYERMYRASAHRRTRSSELARYSRMALHHPGRFSARVARRLGLSGAAV